MAIGAMFLGLLGGFGVGLYVFLTGGTLGYAFLAYAATGFVVMSAAFASALIVEMRPRSLPEDPMLIPGE